MNAYISSTGIEQEYFEWLYGKIGSRTDRNPRHSHRILAEHLFRREFYWSVPNDDNREGDGLQLRDDFCDERGCWAGSDFPIQEPCTVLEFLIGLAERFSFEADELFKHTTVGDCFWHMLGNLGLKAYNDEYCMTLEAEASELIDWTITQLLDREYEYDGEGGLFPLRYPQRDQRETEIWYQMSAYLLENSDIGQ